MSKTLRRTKYYGANGRILARHLQSGAPRAEACARIGLTVKGVHQTIGHVRAGRTTHPARVAFEREAGEAWDAAGVVGRPRKRS